MCTARQSSRARRSRRCRLIQQDQILDGLENGEIALQDGSGKAFFEQILANTIEGFFADPIYGGNRDMAGWKLDRLSGRPLRLSRPRRQAQSALPAAASLDPRAQRLVGPRIETAEPYSMATKLPAKDVVIIGLGWTGAILAQELTDHGLDVVAIERGPWRDTATSFNIGYAPDELRYGVRLDLFQRPAQSTLTFRNNDQETALPIRQWGSFQPGNGVGGAGVHWGGQTWRHLPSDFRIRSHLTERYGASFIPQRAVDPGLGRHLRRDGAVLRPVRVSRRHLRQGRQSQRPSFSRAATRSRGRASASIRCRQCR